ncbi:TPA: ribosomal RNA adenine dimethylase domain-containing protein [Candidatus Sumerlaeota bacterium]|nr:ribosomal RNA adenine dimethylase domain-containing protein [Candidatus Sumerlaeota bacterium]
MAIQSEVHKAGVVVEFGPGSGSITREVVARKTNDAIFFAIEMNPRMCEVFRHRFPEVEIFEDSAENVKALLQQKGVEKANSIVSSLPWAAFPSELQDKLLGAAFDVLEPGGIFTSFAYLQGMLLPAGQRFQKRLESLFPQVSKSRIVWRNLPPAFVYRCVK